MSIPLRLWRVALDSPAPAFARDVLAPDEQARAARFVRAEDSDRFTLMRAALRFALGLRLGLPPASLRFHVGPTGKPSLDLPGGPGLEFSVAHTRGLGLLAVSEDVPLGVDVEGLDTPAANVEPILEILNPEELKTLEALSLTSRTRFLLECWVAREAFVKATGVGLGGMDLRAVERPLGAGNSMVRLRVPSSLEHGEGWWLQYVDTGAAHLGALVTAGPPLRTGATDWTWAWPPGG